MRDRFRLLLENPHKALDEDSRIFDDFIPYAISVADSDPIAGKPLAQVIIKHAPKSCQRVQGWGIWAQIHRAIDDLDEADFAIKQAFFYADDCDSCVADLYRRRAVLRRARKQWATAIEDADKAIHQYLDLGHPGHDIDRNGLASSYNVRAGVYLYVGNATAALHDIRVSLSLLNARVSPVLFRWIVANLAVLLLHNGSHSDLLKSEHYLKKARRLFSGASKRSQERAKLDWLTAQVRYKLGQGRPCQLRAIMDRARADFLALGFSIEAVATGADLMKMKLAKNRWGHGNPRDLCRDVVADLLTVPRLSTEIVASLHQVAASVEECGWYAESRLQISVDQLRKACGPNMMACLLTWESP